MREHPGTTRFQSASARRATENWRVTALASVALLALASPPALPAQQQGDDQKSVPLSKIERKNKAPVSKEILRVQLPRPQEFALDNGLTVLVLEDHRFPLVHLQLLIAGAGPIYEPRDLAGLAGITAQMLREGTRTRRSKEIAEQVDGLGANLFANSGFGSDAATIFASGLSDNFDRWLPLVADVLLNPGFPADELAKLKQRLIVQLKQQRSSPGFLVNEQFSRAVYGKHPASIVSATPDSIRAITPELLSAWHREHYAPQNAILAIAGDVRAAELLPRLKAMLGPWQRTGGAPVLPSNPSPARARKIFLVDRSNSVQTDVALGNIAIDRRSPDYIPMVVMNRVLGDGPESRLFINLREEKGYTYGAYSRFAALKYPGPWRAFANMRTSATDGAMAEFLSEIRRIRETKVPEAELEEAKRSVVASFALSLEDPSQILEYAIVRVIYGLPGDYWDTYANQVMLTTAEAVQRVARQYLDPDALQIVAVGDAGKIRTALEKYGPVETFDTDGKAEMASGEGN